MPDRIDRAQELEQEARERALRRIPRHQQSDWVPGLVAAATPMPGADLSTRRKVLRDAGRCVDCGEPIPRERREAAPESERCVDCQNDQERKGR